MSRGEGVNRRFPDVDNRNLWDKERHGPILSLSGVDVKSLSLLIVFAAGAALTASAEPKDAWTSDRLMDALAKGVPAADLAPRPAEVASEASRAVELLTGGGGEVSSCRAACGEAGSALEALCSGLIVPGASRSKAVCYRRTADLAGDCAAQCPP
jgi:hypothetical protein